MAREAAYIHGTFPEEQNRLSLLNDLTNASFLDFMDIRPGDSILEVGSGLGILANRVATAFPDVRVTGVEIATEQLRKARADFSGTPNLEFIQGDALALDLQESLFDVVYCRYVLEHVHEPQRVLGEMFRLLKADGRIFVQENNILISALYPDCPSYSFILGKFAHIGEVRRASVTNGGRCRNRQEAIQPHEAGRFRLDQLVYRTGNTPPRRADLRAMDSKLRRNPQRGEESPPWTERCIGNAH